MSTDPWAESPVIERRALRGLLLLYSLFIVYGTFIPFRFSADLEFIHSQWAHFFKAPFVNGAKQFSIPDVISNVLLFIPFGFLWVGSELGKPILYRLFGAGFGVSYLGFVFGLAIEVGQIFSPGRTASILDALCNGFGAGVGGVFGYLAFRALRGSLGASLKRTIRDRPSLVLLALLVSALLSNAYYPFDITIDVSTVWESFKHIQWRPFGSGPHRFWLDLLLDKILFFVAIGCMATLNLRHMSVRAAGALAWCLCVVFAAGLETGKLFFAGRVPNPENLIVYMVGALAGIFVVAPLSGRAFVRRHSAFILIAIMLGLELCSELSPFDWVTSIDELRTRIVTIEWLPFAAYYGAAPQSAIFDLAKKLFIVGPVGFVIASHRRRGRLIAALVGLVSGAVLETCQIALRSRTPSITDVLLFVVAAWSGAVVFQRLSEIRTPEKCGAAGTVEPDSELYPGASSSHVR